MFSDSYMIIPKHYQAYLKGRLKPKIAFQTAFFIFGRQLHFLEMRQEGGDAREHADRAHGQAEDDEAYDRDDDAADKAQLRAARFTADEAEVVEQHGQRPAENGIDQCGRENDDGGRLGGFAFARHFHACFKQRDVYADNQCHAQYGFPYRQVHRIAPDAGDDAEDGGQDRACGNRAFGYGGGDDVGAP